MSDTTPDPLAALRAELARVAELDAKAAAGPWELGPDLEWLFTRAHEKIGGFVMPNDARFVAAARTGYPRLAAVVAAMLDAGRMMVNAHAMVNPQVIEDAALAAWNDGA